MLTFSCIFGKVLFISKMLARSVIIFLTSSIGGLFLWSRSGLVISVKFSMTSLNSSLSTGSVFNSSCTYTPNNIRASKCNNDIHCTCSTCNKDIYCICSICNKDIYHNDVASGCEITPCIKINKQIFG